MSNENTKPNFTPGPWEAVIVHPYCASYRNCPGVDCDIFMRIYRGQEEVISPGEYSIDGKEADAHLIAAAPDLYDALATIENDAGHVPGWLWEKIQAALRKARGEG
jgi:hypothetical protein